MTNASPASAELTIISVFYNRGSFVAESVKSVVDQLKPNWTLILVNDGSTDNTLEEIQKFEASNILVRDSSNIGLTNHLVREFASAKSEFIAMHGAGDISHPGRFTEQIKAFRSNERFGLVSCIIRKESPSGEVLSKHYPKMILKNGVLRPHGVSHGEVMYRATAYHEAGGYNSFFSVGQGTPLWYRICDLGYLLHACQEELYSQRIYENGVSKNSPKIGLRRLLFAVDEDVRETFTRTGIDVFQKYKFHAPLFLYSRRHLSKAYFAALLRSYTDTAQELPIDRNVLKKIVLVNSSGRWRFASMIFILTPFKSLWFSNSFFERLLKQR